MQKPNTKPWKVKIGDLPEEKINSTDGNHAERNVADIINGRDSHKQSSVPDDTDVTITDPDGNVYGHNRKVDGFRRRPAPAAPPATPPKPDAKV